MDCCDNCIKSILFTLNFVFSLIGLALIIIGSLLLSDTLSFSSLMADDGDDLQTPQIFMIVIGVIIFFIATIGCCGAIKENKCLLITFAVLLLFIFVLQVAAGIYALTNKDDFDEAVEKGLNREFENIGHSPNIRRLFEKMEEDWECCGVRGAGDYQRYNRAVPYSCCRDDNGCRLRPFDYWPKGCMEVITNFTGKSGNILGGVAIALAFVEVIGAVFALRLASQVK